MRKNTLIAISSCAFMMAGSVGLNAIATKREPPSQQEPAQPQQQLRTGPQLFAQSGCTRCHGDHATGIKGHGPSLTGVGSKLEETAIERQIREGGMSMPPFGDALSADEIEVLA